MKKILNLKLPNFHVWFWVCNKNFRRMIKYLYFISCLYPNLVKFSSSWSSVFFHLVMGDSHFCCTIHFFQKNFGDVGYETWTLLRKEDASILTKFEQQRWKKKQWKKLKKQWNEQPWTLAYTLVFQTTSFPWSCFFWFGPIGFPSKMMPCKLNHNLICLCFGPLSEGL